MTVDRHMWCNEKITYESVLKDNARNPLLQKLWDDAEICLSLDDDNIYCYESYYDDIRDILPKVRTDFRLSYTSYRDMPGYPYDYLERNHERAYRTLKWFAEYLRQLVKRTGEVWYTEHWICDEGVTKKNLEIITYDVNKEICFMKREDKCFSFGKVAFYRFVDGDEQN